MELNLLLLIQKGVTVAASSAHSDRYSTPPQGVDHHVPPQLPECPPLLQGLHMLCPSIALLLGRILVLPLIDVYVAAW
jgi:hypothetical protein